MFIPPLLLALCTTVGATKSSLKMIIIQHPSLLLMPTLTFFTFKKLNTSWCFGERDVRVRLSQRFTLLNMLYSAVFMMTFIHLENNSTDGYIYNVIDIILIVTGVTPTILFLVIYICMDQQTCCQNECCCECWKLPRGQMSVYDPDNQDIELVFRDGRVEKVTDDDKNDEVMEPELEEEI